MLLGNQIADRIVDFGGLHLFEHAEIFVDLKQARINGALRQQQINRGGQHHVETDAQAGQNNQNARRPKIAAFRHGFDMHPFRIQAELIGALLFLVLEDGVKNFKHSDNFCLNNSSLEYFIHES